MSKEVNGKMLVVNGSHELLQFDLSAKRTTLHHMQVSGQYCRDFYEVDRDVFEPLP